MPWPIPEIRYVVDGLPIGPDMNDRGSNKSGWLAREKNRKAREAMREIINRSPRASLYPVPGPFEMEAIFYLPTMRNRDGRQLSVQLKPYEDELVDAGIITGDSWKEIPRHVITIQYRKNRPGFEIILRPLEG